MEGTPASGPPGPAPDSLPLSSGAADPVERILGECLVGEAGDVAARVEDACRRFPEHAGELRERVRLLAEVGFFGASGPEHPAAIPERLGGFKLLRRIGSGGMGVVYLAHEEALERTVALKLIRPEHLYFPESRARFEREVRTIAGMRHPGIVPVFSVGEAQGIPFFAMQYVSGVNLQEVLTRLAGRPTERLTGRDLVQVLAERLSDAGSAEPAERAFGHAWQEVCLRLVLQAAEALEHVHAHGVLHRDIKPSNLMVTPSGRVMLLDFGLSASSGAARITRSGAVAGSLPYMSPEQVRGGLTDVDGRTDVYALGVTLYELLTLLCPYLGKDGEDTRRRILLGEPPPLRERNRAVTWDAETVCLKAMDRDPARRYESPAAFAQDLVRVLEYRPIEARRPGPLLRLRRLAQRRPAMSVAAVLGSVVLLGAPLGWAALEHGAAVRIEAQRQDAERSLGEALRAVNQMLTRVGGSRLRHVPQSHGVRRELLAEALGFCRRLLAARPGHLGIRRETAVILVQAATVQRGLGDHADAERSLTEALALLRQLQAEGSATRSDRVELATAERSMSQWHRERGHLAEAETWARQSLASGEELERQDPGDQKAARFTGGCHATLAEVLLAQERGPAAAVAAESAVKMLQACLEREPGDAPAARALIFALFSLGDVRVKGPTPEALDAMRRAVGLAGDLWARAPDSVEDLELLAVAEGKLGLLLTYARQHVEAEKVARDTVAHRQRLATDFPAWVTFQSELGGALGNLALALMQQRRHEEAVDIHLQSIAAQQRALLLNPEHVTALEHMHTHRANLARSLLAVQRLDEVQALGLKPDEIPAKTMNHHMLRADLMCSCVRATQGRAGDVGDEETSEQEERFASQAVASLEAAVAAGLRDVGRLQTAGFTVLRRRGDYRALLTRMKEQAGSRPAK